MRRSRPTIPVIVVVAVIVICVLGLVAWACSGATRKPAAAPVAVVEPWCIDPVALTLVDDDWCERDDDGDGVVDGHWYVPVKGLVKPAKGGKLPPQVKLGSPNHVVRVPVKVSARPSGVVSPEPLMVRPSPKRSGVRR